MQRKTHLLDEANITDAFILAVTTEHKRGIGGQHKGRLRLPPCSVAAMRGCGQGRGQGDGQGGGQGIWRHDDA